MDDALAVLWRWSDGAITYGDPRGHIFTLTRYQASVMDLVSRVPLEERMRRGAGCMVVQVVDRADNDAEHYEHAAYSLWYGFRHGTWRVTAQLTRWQRLCRWVGRHVR